PPAIPVLGHRHARRAGQHRLGTPTHRTTTHLRRRHRTRPTSTPAPAGHLRGGLSRPVLPRERDHQPRPRPPVVHPRPAPRPDRPGQRLHLARLHRPTGHLRIPPRPHPLGRRRTHRHHERGAALLPPPRTRRRPWNHHDPHQRHLDLHPTRRHHHQPHPRPTRRTQRLDPHQLGRSTHHRAEG